MSADKLSEYFSSQAQALDEELNRIMLDAVAEGSVRAEWSGSDRLLYFRGLGDENAAKLFFHFKRVGDRIGEEFTVNPSWTIALHQGKVFPEQQEDLYVFDMRNDVLEKSFDSSIIEAIPFDGTGGSPNSSFRALFPHAPDTDWAAFSKLQFLTHIKNGNFAAVQEDVERFCSKTKEPAFRAVVEQMVPGALA